MSNRFVYLAHDDGHACKLYSYDNKNIVEIISHKIVAHAKINLQNSVALFDSKIIEILLQYAQQGLLIDLNDAQICKNQCLIRIYIVGKYTDMDIIRNQVESLKNNALCIKELKYCSEGWYIENK